MAMTNEGIHYLYKITELCTARIITWASLPGAACAQRSKGNFLLRGQGGRQPETEAASTGLCACLATDPKAMQSCGHILAVVCLPNHGGYGWL